LQKKSKPLKICESRVSIAEILRQLGKKDCNEIIEHREDFDSPGFGSQAVEIIEKHACHLSQLGTVYSILRWKSFQKKPEDKVPLGKNEFRCFGCGGVILSNEEACSICGWTWK